LAKLYDNGSVIKELENIEENGIKAGEYLKEWENDEWVEVWLKSPPFLHDVDDLRPYFYLTRDALANRVVSNISKLSPQAIEILKCLKSGSDTQLNSALQKAEDTSDYEANEILSDLYNELMSDSADDSNLFKSFLRWGSVKSCLYSETFSLLKNIPKDRIKLSAIPLLSEFAEKTHQKENVMNWLDTLEFDSVIKTAISHLGK
jgi:sulfite reductase alpha subunit-like flavoprotein